MTEEIWFSLRLSLQVALLATLFIVVVGIAVGYLLARKNFWGRELVDILFTLPLVLPPTVTGYYLIILFGRNGLLGKTLYSWTGWSLMFTWYAAVLASFVVALPLVVRTTRAAIESIDKNLNPCFVYPGSFRTDDGLAGRSAAGPPGDHRRAVLSFAGPCGEFGATLMIAGNLPGKTNTLPLTIYTLAGSGDWPQAHGVVLLLTVASGIFLYLANRFSRRAW